MQGKFCKVGALFGALSLSACAVNVPHMGDIGTARQDRVLNEQDLLGHIQCELHTAFEQAKDQADYEQELNASKGTPPNHSIAWLDKWGVKVNLEFQVEASSDIEPGLSVTKTLQNAVKVFVKNGDVTVGRSRTAKFGAGYTRDITRTETIAYFFPFSNFAGYRLLPVRVMRQAPAKYDVSFCSQKTHIVSDDNLQIYDFLHSKLELAATPGLLGEVSPKKKDTATALLASASGPPDQTNVKAQEESKPPFSTLSYDVHFLVTKAFSATPSWTLVEVAVDPDGAFYQGKRVKSDHLIMTFGAPDDGDSSKASNEVDQQHFARLIGQYVGDAINRNSSR